jgi:hypothetical protein
VKRTISFRVPEHVWEMYRSLSDGDRDYIKRVVVLFTEMLYRGLVVDVISDIVTERAKTLCSKILDTLNTLEHKLRDTRIEELKKLSQIVREELCAAV